MIKEIRPEVYAIVSDGHQLRQHYFTKQSAQTADTQIIATTLGGLPDQNVLGIYRYGYRIWSQLPTGHPDGGYYHGMMQRALAELRKRGAQELALIQAL